MKKSRHIIPASATILAASMMILSCVKEEDEPTPTPPQPEPESTTLKVVSNNASEYTIAYATDNASNADQLVRAFRGIFSATLSAVKSSDSQAEPEILLGKTGREESEALLKLIGNNGYGIQVSGKKIVIAGTDADMMGRALYLFQNKVMKNSVYATKSSLEVPKDYSLIQKDAAAVTFSDVIRNGWNYTVKCTYVGACPKQDDCYVSQGAATDGKNVFFVMRNSSDTKAVICKYTLSPFAYVATGEYFNGGHCNDLTYDSVNGWIVLAHGQSEGKILTLISPDTLKKIKDVGIAAGSGAITFNTARRKYAISQGGSSLHFLDTSFSLLDSYTRTDGMSSTYTAQGMGSDDDYIYFPMSPISGKSTDNVLVTYDWNAKHICDIHIPLSMESESMFSTGGKYYVNFYHSSSAKLYQIAPTVSYRY